MPFPSLSLCVIHITKLFFVTADANGSVSVLCIRASHQWSVLFDVCVCVRVYICIYDFMYICILNLNCYFSDCLAALVAVDVSS